MNKHTTMRPNRSRLYYFHTSQRNHEKTKGDKTSVQNSLKSQTKEPYDG